MGILDNIGKALDIANEVRDESTYLVEKKDYYASKEYERDKALVARIDSQIRFIVIFSEPVKVFL